MFSHNKRLQYTVRVSRPNPGLANLMLEQFGGPQGELAAATRYFLQALAEEDPSRKDLLFDIATEELSHLEIIGSIIAMLNRGAKGEIAEGVTEQAELYRKLQGAGNDSHVTQVLYGGGPALINSAGVPWTAAYVDTIGEPTADLRSNIAAEARAKIVYERLLNITDDPEIRNTLSFLMTREIAHQKQFEKALYSIQPNFPPGKLPGKPEFANAYVKLSSTNEMRGPWNTGNDWKIIDHPQPPLDKRNAGLPELDGMSPEDEQAVMSFAARGKSDPSSNPTTGAELGSSVQTGAGAGLNPLAAK